MFCLQVCQVRFFLGFLLFLPNFCFARNCEADQRLCLHYTDSTVPLVSKSKISFLIICACLAWLFLDLFGNRTVGFLMSFHMYKKVVKIMKSFDFRISTLRCTSLTGSVGMTTFLLDNSTSRSSFVVMISQILGSTEQCRTY